MPRSDTPPCGDCPRLSAPALTQDAHQIGYCAAHMTWRFLDEAVPGCVDRPQLTEPAE